MYKKLLVAIDNTSPSHIVLNHALGIAEKFGSEIIILAVAPQQKTYVVSDSYFYAQSLLLDIQERLVIIFKKVLASAETKVKAEHPDIKITAMFKEGSPSVKIVEVAEEEECDMLIMGNSRVECGIFSWFWENTSRSVMNTSNIPVLIIY